MARDGSGSYTLPSGNPVVSGQTISSTWANDTMTDLETEMTASLDRNGKGGMLAVLKGIDGVVGGPAYSFTNEATTGIYRAGSNDLRVSIAGTDRMKVNGSGIAADTISELTADNGVAIDSVTLKDGGITAAGTIDFTGATVTGPSGTWDTGGMDIATGDTYAINSTDVLSATTLGSGVVNSSLTTLGLVTTFESTGIDDNASSTAMTLHATGTVTIGTADDGTAYSKLKLQDGGIDVKSTDGDAFDAHLYLSGYQTSANGCPEIYYTRANGTLASPLKSASGDRLGRIAWTGWDVDGGGGAATSTARIEAYVDGDATGSSDCPGRLQFSTAPDGTKAVTEAMRINNDGTVSIGTTDTPNYLTQLNWGGLQVQHNTAYKASVYLEGYETSVGNAAEFYMKKSRGTQASPATVVDGDSIAYHTFGGQTGATTASNAAAMYCIVDGTVSVGNVPGRLEWHTATDGGGNPTEKMRLNNAGELLIGTTTAGASKLVVNDDSIQINTSKTPSSATDTGTTGQVAWDGSYIYVCIGPNQWRRAAISGGW